MPAPRSTFVNPLLTNISVGYSNSSYVASSFFPTVTVDKESGLYFVTDKEALRAPSDARRGEFSRANRVENTLTTAAYQLEEKSLETPISKRVMDAYQNPFDPKKNATNLVSEKLLLDKEKDLQATILASATANPTTTVDVANAWSTITTDIAGQARTARNSIQKNTGQKANTLILGKPSLDALLKNTAFLDSIKYVQVVNEDSLRNAIASYFDVSRVLLGDSIENKSVQGQADSLDYVWGDVAIFGYVSPSPALETPSAGYELALNNARYIDEWYEQEIKTWFVRANDFYDNKVVDPFALYTITNTAV